MIELFKNKAKTIVSYSGNSIDYKQVNEVLSTVWTKLEDSGLEIAEVKIVYSVVTEMLENAFRYSCKVEDCNDCLLCTVTDLGKKQYEVVVKNPIELSKAEKLKDKVDFVNSLSPNGLKKYYQHEIIRTKNENHSGAGLGLIIIARKSKEPLLFEIKPLRSSISLVTIRAVMKI